MNRADLQDLHSVLRRAAERAERKRRRSDIDTPDHATDQLRAVLAEIETELARSA